MPQPFVARAVLQAVRALPGYPSLRVLDLSTARGEIPAALQRDGATVRGTHYRTDDYKLVGCPSPSTFPIDNAVDLTKPLPYADGAFDVVLLIEVLEHIEVHRTVIQEIGRVLVPGGYFLLTTPNIARLHSRFHYLLTGTHKLIRRRVGWDIPPSELYAYHINPVEFPLLHTLLFHAGLRVRRLFFTRRKLRQLWLLALYPVVWLATSYETSHRITGPAHALGERDLRHWLRHPALLASEQLMLVARRESTAAGESYTC